MIFTLIIQMFLNLITWLFSWFQIPKLPQVFQDSLDFILKFFTTPIGIFRNFLSDGFFEVVIVLIIGFMLISPLLHFSIWLYKRIRG